VLGLLTTGGCSQYTVAVVSKPAQPVISYMDGSTAWPQSFNPSFVEPSEGTGQVSGLLVRAQNCSQFVPGVCIGCNVDAQHPVAPYFPGSVLTFAKSVGDGTFEQPYLVYAPDPDAPTSEDYGTEDPRIAYDAATGLYHLFYTCYGSTTGPRLCHSTTRDPTAPYPGNWTRLGAVFPQLGPNTKSGALLVRPQPPHYLYWGAGTIALAVSTDLVDFSTVNASFISARPGSFDSMIVEAGPPPLLLRDGNIIFFHNSDNASAVNPGDFGSYNAGWVILNGTDPSQILQRSNEPLLSPTFGWEFGLAPWECNV